LAMSKSAETRKKAVVEDDDEDDEEPTVATPPKKETSTKAETSKVSKNSPTQPRAAVPAADLDEEDDDSTPAPPSSKKLDTKKVEKQPAAAPPKSADADADEEDEDESATASATKTETSKEKNGESAKKASTSKDDNAEEESENTRGIPAAQFIDNVEEYVKSRGGNAEPILKELHTLYGKYKFMEGRLIQQKRALITKIPDITNALDALRFLIAKRALNRQIRTTYQLSDAVFARASVDLPHNDTVMLWLGANVMLEYDFKEAETLLTANLRNAQTNLSNLNKDLHFLKDQITVSEVNIARTHNYRVKANQEARAKGVAAGGTAATASSGGGGPRRAVTSQN